MQQTILPLEGSVPSPMATSRTAQSRLAVGLIQGFTLYLLYHAAKSQIWPAIEPLLFAPLLLVALFVPVLMMSGLGHLQNRALGRWILLASLIAAGLGVHDSWRSVGAPAWEYGRDIPQAPYPSLLLWVFGAAGFYIAHVLILAAAADQKRIASYSSYFDSAWKLLIQILFSALFVGVFWIVLALGAALFKLIQLNFLQELLRESWFAIPVTVFAFACALHLTDVRPAIVRGIRNLALVLLSWILPVALLIVGGFLCSLPVTGLAQLWATKHATALLLAAAAVLVLLINAAFQNGLVADEVAHVLRVSARLASFLLVSLVVIAIYALSLRVGEHGWTTDRIIAACCLLVASCYAIGYAWAASGRTGWLHGVAPVNIATAFVILALLLALFSPVLDPARISVANQVARLESGIETAERFDFDYLKFEGKRYGLAALENFKVSAQGKDAALVRENAALSLGKKYRAKKSGERITRQELNSNLKVWPKNQPIPESFTAQNWAEDKDPWRLPTCLRSRTESCDVYPMDLDGSGNVSLLVIAQNSANGQASVFAQEPDGHWRVAATLANNLSACAALREKLQTGQYRLLTSLMKDIEIGGKRIPLHAVPDPTSNCDAIKK